jgi:NCS1 family nucleobase:cation symporter-1
MAGMIESHGVDSVPTSARTHGWLDLFTMYAGVNICLPMIITGGVLVPGMTFWQAVLVGLLGNGIAAAFACLVAYPGVDHGLPVSVVTRMSLGFPRGTWIASSVIIISLLGWYAVQAEMAGLAADGVVKQLGGGSHPTLMIVLMGLVSIYFAVMGFVWMQRIASWSVPALLLFCGFLFATIAWQRPFLEIVSRPGTGSLTFLQGMNIMVSGQIAGGFLSSDIARYARNRRAVWYGILLGIAPVAAFMISLGALSSLATGEWNPVIGVQGLGLGVPALLLIVFATLNTNDKNLYSGGLALTNLLPSTPRWRHTLVLGLLGTLLGCTRPSRFFIQWLVALGMMFAPLVGIVLSDYLLVRRASPMLADIYRSTGTYRYTGGVNLAALLAIAAGVVAGRLAPPQAMQPIVALVVSAGTYLVAMRLFQPDQGRSTRMAENLTT